MDSSSEPPEGANPADTPILNFWSLERRENKFLLFWAAKVCHGGPRSQTRPGYPLRARTGMDSLSDGRVQLCAPFPREFWEPYGPTDAVGTHSAGARSPAEETWGPL